MRWRWRSLLFSLNVLVILMLVVLAFIFRFSGDTVSAIWYLLVATFGVLCMSERRP